MESVLKDLIPRLAAEGVFGDCASASCSVDSKVQGEAQFASEICFAVLRKVLPSGEIAEVPVVIKIQLQDPIENEMRDIGTQFRNEVIIYNEILPFLNVTKSRLYPDALFRQFSGLNEAHNNVLILENMFYSGFSPSKQKLFLDFDHIAISLKRLGELHSWSYRSKSTNKSEFFDLAKKLKNLNFKCTEEFDYYFLVSESIRGSIEPFIEQNIEVDLLQDFIKPFESLQTVIEVLVKPEEPFSTICHGDFNKNNVLYKYNDANQPIDCAIFDFQRGIYSSPAIDVSFFLYMHTSAEIRRKHWNDFLKIYYNSVRDNLPGDIDLPDYEQFLEHFSTRAVFGYIHAAFFVPMMMREKPLNVTETRALSKAAQIDYFRNAAGEEGRKVVNAMASHMLDHKYFHKFVEYYKSNVTS